MNLDGQSENKLVEFDMNPNKLLLRGAMILIALGLGFIGLTSHSQVSEGKRIALVIGNDSYQNVNKLQKAGNDATAMARELKAAGFEVLQHRDLNYRGMVKAVETLIYRINGGDQVVVFFAGHGVQIKTGSYLLPIDIEGSSETEVEKTAYGLNDLTDKLSEAKASFTLVIVDACRDNPLKSNGRNVGGARGLNAIEPPKGQMVVYSASKGQQALDKLSEKDANPNSVFTREFIRRMKRPGIRIEDLVREVQDSVEALARTVNHDQRPAIYNEARGNFYFFRPSSARMGPHNNTPPDAGKIEDENWKNIKDKPIQSPPERPSPKVTPNETERPAEIKRNPMAAAVSLIDQAPKKYQIHIRDLIKGDVYSDIQSVVVDRATGWTVIHFNYRGRTSVSLMPVGEGSYAGSGSYPISIPLLGNSDVKVNLTFAPDGTARGVWNNMGYSGAFDITKKY